MGISDDALNELTKSMLERHNTFFRGVDFGPDIKDLMKKLNISKNEALKIAATSPREEFTHIWVSPTTSIADLYGKTAKIRRPYKLGTDRVKWFNEANFEVSPPHQYGGDLNAEVIYPWWSKTELNSTTIPTELLLKKGEFVEWLRNTDIDGSNNRIFTKPYEGYGPIEFLSPDAYRCGGKL